jgi:hypothetical protein
MPTDVSATPSRHEARVLDFARAFRSAARAVSFYPASHQAVVTALDQVVSAARAATVEGSLCLTILPHAFLAGGEPIDSSQSVVSELAALCHRHGVGALHLDGRASADAWQAFFTLLARRPEDVRNAGGIQRQWRALRRVSPAILEIDFGALLRGKVGGDYSELAAVISHYLETAGVGGSILDDPCAALRQAIDAAPDEAQAVSAVLRELRAAAHLTAATPERFEDVFQRAAAVGEYLSEGVMAGLLERRGTVEATIGTLDVVQALVERMPDAVVSTFLSKALGEAGAEPARLAGTFHSLVPSADRRRLIVSGAQDVALGSDVVAQWAEFERNLESQLDRRFVSDQYGEELHAVQIRAASGDLASDDPPGRVAAWVASISDEAVRELDLLLLGDLARHEDDAGRVRKILDILQASVLEAAAAGDWDGAARTVEAIQSIGTPSGDVSLQLLATESLQRLGASPAGDQALAALPVATPEQVGRLISVLAAIGAPLMPAIARLWAADRQATVGARFEQAVAAAGRSGRDGLRRLLTSNAEGPETRVAAIRLLDLTPGTDHLPALEASLSDADEGVRAEAFRALSASTTDRASEILARGIARADLATQLLLLTWLKSRSGHRSTPVLQRLAARIDPQTSPVAVSLALVGAIERCGGADAEGLIGSFVGRTQWHTPLRTWRIRSAAKAALRAVRQAGRAVAPPSATRSEAG